MAFFKNRQFSILLGCHVVLWSIVSQLVSPSLDPYGDMIESYAWGQRLTMGSFKHPPFLGWLNHIWFSVFPVNSISYYFLAYLNAIIGVLGILALTRLWLKKAVPSCIKQRDSKQVILLSLVFSLLSGAYSHYAAKYNADTILISIWPWITLVFFLYYYHYPSYRPIKKITIIVLFSFLSAIGILAKYFTGVLLISLFLISLFDRQMRLSYKTVYPYIAIALVGIFLFPHIWWEYQMNFPFSHYLGEKFDSQINIARIFNLILTSVYQLPLSWLAFFLIYLKARSMRRNDTLSHQENIYKLPLHLVLICILPVSVTVLAGLFLGVHLTSHWAIPIWFGLPILMAFLLLNHIQYIKRSIILYLLGTIWASILLSAAVLAIFYGCTGNSAYTLARQEMAYAIEQRFKIAFPEQQLSWVSGTWTEPAALAFYLSSHPIALPAYPNEMPALVNPYPDWNKRYGAIICYNSPYGDAKETNGSCILETEAWLKNNKIELKKEKVYYDCQYFLCFKKPLKAVTVFWIMPMRNG